MPEELTAKQKQAARKRRWAEKLRQDPVRLAAFRKHNARYVATVKPVEEDAAHVDKLIALAFRRRVTLA